MEVRAKLRFYRQSPKKVRQVVDLIRGRSVPVAQAQLKALPKKSALAIAKLLASAVANAENRDENKLESKDLFIKEIKVDQGPTYKRFRPRAHGRASMIRKRTSHVSIVLGEKELNKVDKQVKSAKRKVQNDSVKLKTKK
jgi:large subunit ribosomal protein L22